MCGRYALGLRAAFVRYQLQQQGMPVDDAPGDDEARETYNFPPGSFGLVYRADVPDQGVRDNDEAGTSDAAAEHESQAEQAEQEPQESTPPTSSQSKHFNYQLKVMKWGLIPFWTKRAPDYGSMLRTINCRDDSLIENRGMWNTMKQKKRCLVVAQGFYEWLKKGPGGKERIPYFVKRKDGNLMWFAGLWDCVKYEDTGEKLYTYTIITTDANKQLQFLHDRMPVILTPGTEEVKMWLDPTRNKWSKELQAILKPYEGELECYQVDSAVGKVGNNSPSFIVPVDSKENKKNIANFFSNAGAKKATNKVKVKPDPAQPAAEDTGDGKDVPLPGTSPPFEGKQGMKREHDDQSQGSPTRKHTKVSSTTQSLKSPQPKRTLGKKPKSATSNKDMTLKSSPAKKVEPGMQQITNFFSK
ncbi:hypothetical protein Z517_06937 [Fonsecaea pedrosoi CBS 271.37]|uniref:DUF159 domain protein n=1 Tax=Fonsecaea pedrosoi CBS 271.37 TaxID=1442368 RepID=A0A0D2F114_9EURO|nr:uncharacterized protein Z517_06937 [Fonsecaea pedrosoi CBS 271.37]KIW80322.1 hypothetical protein Z517_06937 [Fonsecaea pedrosoi CBS 271.37]